MDTYDPGRPIMTRAELQEHHAEDSGRDYRFSDDGYSDMAHEQKQGWKVISGWGRDGWDLGNWPYVAFYVRSDRGPYELMQIVEGDRSRWTFPTLPDLYAAIDYLFLWYAAEEEWSPLTWETRNQLDEGALRIDLQFRGPYRTVKEVKNPDREPYPVYEEIPSDPEHPGYRP